MIFPEEISFECAICIISGNDFDEMRKRGQQGFRPEIDFSIFCFFGKFFVFLIENSFVIYHNTGNRSYSGGQNTEVEMCYKAELNFLREVLGKLRLQTTLLYPGGTVNHG